MNNDMGEIYFAEVSGCDGATYVIVDLTAGQAAAVRGLALVVADAAKFRTCGPTLTIKRPDQLSEWERASYVGDEHSPITLGHVPPLRIMARYQHLHVDEQCVKNRWGVCEA